MTQDLTCSDPAPVRDLQQRLTNSVMHTTIDPFGSDGWARYLSPTIEIYGELQTAFSYFNRELFGDALPNCLITLQRKGRRTYGFFAPDRFANNSGRIAVAVRTLQVSPFAVSWFDADGIFILRPAPVDPTEPDDASGRRAKFTCSNCGANAWGRASLKLLCLDCNRGMSRT